MNIFHLSNCCVRNFWFIKTYLYWWVWSPLIYRNIPVKKTIAWLKRFQGVHLVQLWNDFFVSMHYAVENNIFSNAFWWCGLENKIKVIFLEFYNTRSAFPEDKIFVYQATLLVVFMVPSYSVAIQTLIKLDWFNAITERYIDRYWLWLETIHLFSIEMIFS